MYLKHAHPSQLQTSKCLTIMYSSYVSTPITVLQSLLWWQLCECEGDRKNKPKKKNICINCPQRVTGRILVFWTKRKTFSSIMPCTRRVYLNYNVLQRCRDTLVSAVCGGQTCWRGQCHQSADNLRRHRVNDKRQINTTARLIQQYQNGGATAGRCDESVPLIFQQLHNK